MRAAAVIDGTSPIEWLVVGSASFDGEVAFHEILARLLDLPVERLDLIPGKVPASHGALVVKAGLLRREREGHTDGASGT